MIQTVGKFLGLRREEGQEGSGACSQCDPAVLATCKAAEAGTVKLYTRQVLLRVGVDGEGPQEKLWPRSVEGMKSVDPVARALKTAAKDGSVADKVTLTVYTPQEGAGPALAPGTADIMVFPDGVVLRGVPEEELAGTVVAALASGEPSRVPGIEVAPGLQWEGVPPLTLLVCSHMHRDSRCGVLGPQLAARLTQLLADRGLGPDQATVIKSSHVGGHAYAGIMVTYWPGHPTHGDWYGGVNADNAEEFLDAFLESPAEMGGGAGDPRLRPHWRGRLGLTKEEQLETFEACAGRNRDIEDLVQEPVAAVPAASMA